MMDIDIAELRKYAFKTDSNADWLFFAALLEALGEDVYKGNCQTLLGWAHRRGRYRYLTISVWDDNQQWSGNDLKRFNKPVITRQQLEQGVSA